MGRKERFFAAVGTAGLKNTTAENYWGHVERFIQYLEREHHTIYPSRVGVPEISGYLTCLYTQYHLSARTRNQACAALKFLYSNVIGSPLDEDACKKLRAKQSQHTRRTLIGKSHLSLLFRNLPSPHRLLFQLSYAGAMRLSDVIQLRVKDLDFEHEQINICECKHDHFRPVPFPKTLHDAVRNQIKYVETLQLGDFTENPNGVPLPDARRVKAPTDANSLAWYWLFPSDVLSRDRQSGFFGRYHIDADHARKVFKTALAKAKIDRRITPHDLRRTAATRMHFELGMPLTRLQAILGHNSLDQTREYILEDEIAVNGSMSPFDQLTQ
jgi:integrase